jgi:hypothetical protein
MKYLATVVALSAILALATVQAGESPYNPGAPSNAETIAKIKFVYFCRSDSADGKTFYMTDASPEPVPWQPELIRAIDVGWGDYLTKIYGARNVRYPHCNEGTEPAFHDLIKSFTDQANALHKQIVKVDWHYGG